MTSGQLEMLQCFYYFFENKFFHPSATFSGYCCQMICMNDTELISQLLNGNRNAFTFLVSRYQKLVVHIAGRIIQRREELDDVCQEVFIKVYQNLGNYRNECKLSTWIATIAYNTSINFLRRINKWETVNPNDSTVLKNLAGFSGESYETTDLHRYLREQIELLPLHYRTVLTLFHLEEFSYQEIEQITGMPEGTVKSYLFRAKAILKEKLKFVVDGNSLKLVKEISNEK